MQPKLTGLTGEMNLGVFHKELQKWIEGNGQIMERVLGLTAWPGSGPRRKPCRRFRREAETDQIPRSICKLQAALASTLVSRTWATLTGACRCSMGRRAGGKFPDQNLCPDDS